MENHACRVLEWPQIVEALTKHATSDWGKDRCRAMTIFDRVDEVSHALRLTSEARDLIEVGASFPLGGIRDLRTALVRLRQGAMLPGPALLEIADTLGAAKRMKNFLTEHEDGFEALFELGEPIMPLDSLTNEIHRCFDASGEVSDHASPELSTVRQKVKRFNSQLRDRLQHMLHTHASALQEPIITIRRDRFVLPVRADAKSQVPGIVHDQSASGVTLYIEPMAVVDLNNQLNQARMQESAEVEKVLIRLSELAANHADAIEENALALAEIDFTVAKAQYSFQLKGLAPRLDEKGHTRLFSARHPLLALAGRVVPIDVEVGGKWDTLLITGPNTGGKTVTLKTLGLITLMAQAGLHVPVHEGSQLGVFREVYADIGDEQSIAQSLSTFSGHMRNLIRILDESDHHSLVLLDEIGAGTDPSEGVVLAQAMLEALQARGAKTVATTHYGELKRLAFTHVGFENASVEFNNETLSPTYRLLMGVPGQSNAINIATRLGLPTEIAERALKLAEEGSQESSRMIRNLEEEKIAAIVARRDAEEARAEVRRMEAEYHAKLDGWLEEKAKLKEKLAADLSAEMKKAREEINETIRELQGNKTSQAAQKAQSKLGRIVARVQSKPEKPKPKNELSLGDRVYLEKLGQNAEVVSLPDAAGNVGLAIGPMKITANIKEIAPPKEGKTMKVQERHKVKVQAPRSVSVESERRPSLEVDVRGMIADDALFEVEQFLDTAFGNDVKHVTIIHGAGTGVLRKKIREYLKDSPYVASFRVGAIGEGGDGVTIVDLA